MSETRHIAGASEIKFVVDAATGETIREWARRHLEPDPHGGGVSSDVYETTTLYFDTPTRDVFHRRGSNGRAKYRIRRYGTGDTVFLERKLRTSSSLTKRRTLVATPDLARLAHVPSDSDDWLGRWFERRVAARALGPVCQIFYRRTARGTSTESGLARLTIDEALHATETDAIRFKPALGIPVLAGRQIVEMKFRTAMPVVFKRLIEELTLVPGTVSKYRLGMTALGGVDGADPDEPAATQGMRVKA
jgi:hypothetical protein